jgi:von Willebrand factor type A domain
MQAVGETYIPAGLLWGWNVLDAGEPFTQAKTDDQMKAIGGTKFLVLMTDGENTLSPIFQYHYGTDKNLANSKMITLCNNIKQAGITVYTVGFKVDSSTAKDLLESCASDPSKAFDAADDAALQASFYTIAKQLATLRLSK